MWAMNLIKVYIIIFEIFYLDTNVIKIKNISFLFWKNNGSAN
jgi:hypothetical protein